MGGGQDRTIMLRMDLEENRRVGGQGAPVCIYALKHDVMTFLDDKLNGTALIFSFYRQGSQRHDHQFLATRIVNILVAKISIQVASFQEEDKSRSRSFPWKYRATYRNVPDSYTYGLLVMITMI